MPIYNWWKVHETSDYGHVLKHYEKHGGVIAEVLHDRWEAIYNTYIERFGFSQEMLDIFNREKKIALLKVKRMTTGDKRISTEIKIEQHILEEIRKRQTGKVDFYEVKAGMEMATGIKMDPKVVTVAEFFAYLSTLKKHPKHGRGQDTAR